MFLKGARGESGRPGLTGEAGPPGISGKDGLSGEKGSPGSQGAAGPIGFPGPRGPAGQNGSPGETGVKGMPVRELQMLYMFTSKLKILYSFREYRAREDLKVTQALKVKSVYPAQEGYLERLVPKENVESEE